MNSDPGFLFTPSESFLLGRTVLPQYKTLQTDRWTDRRHTVPKTRPIVRSAKNINFIYSCIWCIDTAKKTMILMGHEDTASHLDVFFAASAALGCRGTSSYFHGRFFLSSYTCVIYFWSPIYVSVCCYYSWINSLLKVFKCIYIMHLCTVFLMIILCIYIYTVNRKNRILLCIFSNRGLWVCVFVSVAFREIFWKRLLSFWTTSGVSAHSTISCLNNVYSTQQHNSINLSYSICHVNW